MQQAGWKILCLIVCFAYSSNAQQSRNIIFKNYTSKDGLPNENCNSILEDSRGHLWIGSYEGLHRFDGLTFKSFYANHKDSNSFTSNYVEVIKECKKGQVIFRSDKKLYQIDIITQTVKPFPLTRNKKILAPPVALNNELFLTVTTDQLIFFDKNLQIVRREKNTAMKNVGRILYLNESYLLFHEPTPSIIHIYNTKNRTYKRLNIDYKAMHPKAINYNITHFDSTINRLYLAYFFGNNYYIDIDFKQIENKHYKPIEIPGMPYGDWITSLPLSPKLFLTGNHNGLHIANGQTQVYIQHQKENESSLPEAAIRQITQAGDGSFWMATGAGISQFKLDNPLIHVLYYPWNSKKEELFKSFVFSKEKKLYALRMSSGLYEIDLDFQSINHIKLPISYYWSMMQKEDELIVVGNEPRIVSMDINRKKYKVLNFLKPYYPLVSDLVLLSFKSKNGDEWYSINGRGGLVHIEKVSNKITHYSNLHTPKPFDAPYYRQAHEDKEGNIWFTSIRSLKILKWNSNSKTFTEFDIAGLTKEFDREVGVNSSYLDAQQNLWLNPEGNGLLRYNIVSKTGRYYDLSDGLPTNQIVGITEDAAHRIWINTDKGLCCYNPSKDKFIVFTKKDGFPDDKFTGYAISYDKITNRLYTSTSKFLYYFDVDSLLRQARRSNTRLYIDQIRVNGDKVISTGSMETLRANENNITFELSAVDFYRNNQLEFAYSLDTNKGWISIGNQRTISFNHLPSGRYTLFTKCKHKEADTWILSDSPFTFQIATPWYRTWWFIVVVALLISFIIWQFVSLHYKRKLENQKAALEKERAIQIERFRIASDMHDDLGTSLSRIRFVTSAIQEAETEEEKQKGYEKIIALSDDSVDKMNEIIWSLKQEKFSVEEMFSYIRRLCSQMAEETSIEFKLELPEYVQNITLNAQTCRNLYLVIKESIHNAVKYSQCNTLYVKAQKTSNGLAMLVKDDGKGFDVNKKETIGNGLSNMKKRMKDIQGTLSIDSGEGGTSISLHILNI